MIKLETSYSLGSMIESDFLGISNDVDPDSVIVTLSKKMVTCYNVCIYLFCNIKFVYFITMCVILQIPSQHQINGWSSSNKLSSEVIFDQLTNCYYGVFNYTRIGKWLPLSLTTKDMRIYNVSFFSSIINKLMLQCSYYYSLYLGRQV